MQSLIHIKTIIEIYNSYIELRLIILLISFNLQDRKESGKRGRKPGRKASSEKIDMKAKLGLYINSFQFTLYWTIYFDYNYDS